MLRDMTDAKGGVVVAEKGKKKKADVVAMSLRVPREHKDRLDALVARMPGNMSVNALIVQMLDTSLPTLEEVARMVEAIKTAPNPSLVVERMDAVLEDAKRDANTYATLMNTTRRAVAAQHEAEDTRE
jgi:predicted DNA-binding protein